MANLDGKIKIIVVDARREFLNDLSVRMLLDDDRNIEIVSTLETPDNLHTAINSFAPDVVVVCDNVLDMQEDWHYDGVTIAGYALSEGGKSAFAQKGLGCYGVVHNTIHLLNLLDSCAIPTVSKHNKTPQHSSQTYVVEKQQSYSNKQLLDDCSIQHEHTIKSANEQSIQRQEEIMRKPPLRTGNTSGILQQSLLRKKDEESRKASDKLSNAYYKKKEPAKVITVYSAKGGVGKTTLSTEIAVYLSCMGHGRGKYRTCIVDYNIDFGDVRSTLGLDNGGVDMCLWAADIRERLSNGENPDSITYTKREIETYLQVMNGSGLFALCAPNTHEESMEIEENELQIMLYNLINNADFDFVVCDTGNNTRDSSVFALESADVVLLVATQDVTTASCNKSAIEALSNIDFNTGKIQLVINNILPVKYTGIQAKDVEDYFSQFPCIARVKHDLDIVKANNLNTPIVYQANHEITKELRKIIAFITGNDDVAETPKRKNFLDKFRRR